MTVPFVGAVLTGGSSSRLGTDKALVVVDGVALAVRVAAALRAAGAAEVLAVGGDVDGLAALGCFDRIVADGWPAEGPLGGILTAFGATDAPVLVALACDTPAITEDCPRALVSALADDADIDVALGVVDGRDQPLTAAWRRTTAGAVLHRAFADGERAPRAVLPLLRVARIGLEPHQVADVDRPEDLSRYARTSRRTTAVSDEPRSRR